MALSPSSHPSFPVATTGLCWGDRQGSALEAGFPEQPPPPSPALCNPLTLPAKGVGRNPHRRVLLGVQLSLSKGSTLALRHGRALWAPSFTPRRAAHAPASHAPAVATQRPQHCPLARPACACGDGMGRAGWAAGGQGGSYTAEQFQSQTQPWGKQEVKRIAPSWGCFGPFGFSPELPEDF